MSRGGARPGSGRKKIYLTPEALLQATRKRKREWNRNNYERFSSQRVIKYSIKHYGSLVAQIEARAIFKSISKAREKAARSKYLRDYAARHPERLKERHARRWLKIKDAKNAERRREDRVTRAQLGDQYIKQRIRATVNDHSFQPPPEMIEATRVFLKLKRVLKENENA